MPRYSVPFASLGPDASQFNAGPMQLRRNIAMRQPNMLEPVPGYEEICDVINNYIGRRIWSFKTLPSVFEMVLWASAGSSYACRAYDINSEITPTVADATLLDEPCGAMEARGRVFYAGPRGALVFDSNFTEARMLGMLPPTLVTQSSTTTTDAAAVPASSAVDYRATLHRKIDSGYEISSAPSYVFAVDNSDPTPRDFTIRVGWVDVASSDERVREGDIVRLWRTRSVATGTSPNATFHLSLEHELEAADITARYVDIRDTTSDDSLASAEELYTNPGAQGANQANTTALSATTDVAWFNSHAFYAVRTLPAFLKVGVNSVFGTISTSAETRFGIGTRTVVGDLALGSPVISTLSATELLGAAIGQAVTASGFTAAARIISINTGAGTVTVNENSSVTSVGATVVFRDVVSFFGGTGIVAGTVDEMLEGMHTANVPIVTSVSIPVSGALMYGVQFLFQTIAPVAYSSGVFFAATNHANWSPQVTAFDWWVGSFDERSNRLLWSKLDQPEHVPASNELTVGRGEIVRMVATQDRLFVFCTDGTYVVTGSGGSWSVDIFDRDIVIASQQAVAEMNGNVYVYAKDRGLLRIEAGGGVSNLTKGALQTQVIDPLIASVVDADTGEYIAHVVCDELHDECGLFFVTDAIDAVAASVFVFNARTQDWRVQTPGVDAAGDSAITCWAYSPKRRSVVWTRLLSSGGGEPTWIAALLKNQPDYDDDTTPIPGASMMTYPIVPDDDMGSQKRFHEVLLTLSALDTVAATNMIYTVSENAIASGSVTKAATAIPGNPSPTAVTPAYFQWRTMISRQAHVGPQLALNIASSDENTHRWRLHKIEVTWEPASARSYNR